MAKELIIDKVRRHKKLLRNMAREGKLLRRMEEALCIPHGSLNQQMRIDKDVMYNIYDGYIEGGLDAIQKVREDKTRSELFKRIATNKKRVRKRKIDDSYTPTLEDCMAIAETTEYGCDKEDVCYLIGCTTRRFDELLETNGDVRWAYERGNRIFRKKNGEKVVRDTSKGRAECYMDLAEAVITKAFEDYKVHGENGDVYEMKEILRFVDSSWFSMLSHLDTDRVKELLLKQYDCYKMEV